MFDNILFPREGARYFLPNDPNEHHGEAFALGVDWKFCYRLLPESDRKWWIKIELYKLENSDYDYDYEFAFGNLISFCYEASRDEVIAWAQEKLNELGTIR